MENTSYPIAPETPITLPVSLLFQLVQPFVARYPAELVDMVAAYQNGTADAATKQKVSALMADPDFAAKYSRENTNFIAILAYQQLLGEQLAPHIEVAKVAQESYPVLDPESAPKPAPDPRLNNL